MFRSLIEPSDWVWRVLWIPLLSFSVAPTVGVKPALAQLNYLNARIRYTNAQYQAKVAEIALKEISATVKL